MEGFGGGKAGLSCGTYAWKRRRAPSTIIGREIREGIFVEDWGFSLMGIAEGGDFRCEVSCQETFCFPIWVSASWEL